MTPAIPGGGFNWLPQRLWGILRATWFFLHIIIQTFVFTDCPWFTPQSRSENHWVEDCEGSITCRTLSSGEDHELGRGIPWHLEMMDTWQDHEWTRLPFWRSNGSCDRNRHLHIMAPSYMMIPDPVFTGSSWRPAGPWFQHEFWMSSCFLPSCFWCPRVPEQKLPVA